MWLNLHLAVQALHHHWPWFWPLVAGVLGAVLGSFLNCARHRLPRGMSLRHPPSHCPSCDTILGIPDLIPIISWLFLHGKCRHCAAPIPPASLIIEVFMALIAAAVVVILF